MSTADLAQLVERLEKVTSRLESASVGGGSAGAAAAPTAGGGMGNFIYTKTLGS